jgi:hypothetical protein
VKISGMDSDFIPIAQVPFFDVTDVNSVDAAFAGAQELEFKPSARLPQGAVFCGGKVFLGWTADCLAVDARLDDNGVWTAARHRNDPLFMLGDTLELFAAVHGEKNYIEYHYAPNGLTLQLRWPENARDLDATGRGGLAAYQVVDDAAEYALHPTARGWRVCVLLPARSLGLDVRDLMGCVWDISFGRYDYSVGGGTPVLSSTTRFSRPDFHLRAEWPVFRFC